MSDTDIVTRLASHAARYRITDNGRHSLVKDCDDAIATITALRAALRECDAEIVKMYLGICNGKREAAENFAARSPAVLRARALLDTATERATS